MVEIGNALIGFTFSLCPVTDHVVGIDLGGSQVRALLSQLSGEPVVDAAAPTATGGAPAVVAQISDLALRVALDAGVEWSRVASLAVGVPGVVSAGAGGALSLAPNLPPFHELDLAARLGADLAVPVVVDNDVNVATLAEQHHGHGVGVANFVFIAVGTGVGMGIVSSGVVQRGAHGAAGEIGYLPVGADPFDPAHHAHGPLEEAAGGVGIVRRYAARTGARGLTLAASDIAHRAERGDADADAVVSEQARALALAVVSIISVLDPALVVFGGGIGSRRQVVARVEAEFSRLTRRTIPLRISKLGERAGLIGATELARAHAHAERVLGMDGVPGSIRP